MFPQLYHENPFQQIDKIVKVEKDALGTIEDFYQTRRISGIPGIFNDGTKEGMDNFERALLLGRKVGLRGALYDATSRLPGVRAINFLTLTYDLTLKHPLSYPEAIEDVVQTTRYRFASAFEDLFRHSRDTSMKVICGSNPRLDAMITGERVVLIKDLYLDTKPRVYVVTKGMGNSGEIVATWRPFPDDDTEKPRTAYCAHLISERDARKVLEISARYYKAYLYNALVSFTLGRGMRNERLPIKTIPSQKNWLVG